VACAGGGGGSGGLDAEPVVAVGQGPKLVADGAAVLAAEVDGLATVVIKRGDGGVGEGGGGGGRFGWFGKTNRSR
jgi:hypothetical protein